VWLGEQLRLRLFPVAGRRHTFRTSTPAPRPPFPLAPGPARVSRQSKRGVETASNLAHRLFQTGYRQRQKVMHGILNRPPRILSISVYVALIRCGTNVDTSPHPG
jgi:hypothetical protein